MSSLSLASDEEEAEALESELDCTKSNTLEIVIKDNDPTNNESILCDLYAEPTTKQQTTNMFHDSCIYHALIVDQKKNQGVSCIPYIDCTTINHRSKSITDCLCRWGAVWLVCLMLKLIIVLACHAFDLYQM